MNQADERLDELRFGDLKECSQSKIDILICDSKINPLLDEIEEVIGFKLKKTKRRGMRFIIENLIFGKGLISMNLSDRYYTSIPSRYNPKKVYAKLIRHPLKILIEFELVEFFKGYNYARCKMLSRIKAEKKLKKLFRKHGLTNKDILKDRRSDNLILKNEKKKLADYSDQKVKRFRKGLGDYNNCLDRFNFTLDGDVMDVYYKRVFNNSSFREGGRFYADIQNLTKEERKRVLISGKSVIEYDYSGLHINMLYALSVKRNYEEGDVYLIKGYEKQRPLFKKLLQIVINSKNKTKARAAFRYEVNIKNPNPEMKKVNPDELIDAFEKKHDAIKDYFYTGVGVHLQRLDAKMTEYIVGKASKRYHIPVISVHDSYIVEKENSFLIQKLMREASKLILGVEVKVERA